MDFINEVKKPKGMLIIALFVLILLALVLSQDLYKTNDSGSQNNSSSEIIQENEQTTNDSEFHNYSEETKVHITLVHSVDEQTMQELIDVIKKRLTILDLGESTVISIDDDKINMWVPTSDEEELKIMEEVLLQKGVFEAIVDGKVAITGEDIIPNTVKQVPPQQLVGGADWGVSFTITSEAAKDFAEIVEGKANFPLYMFLDRPHDAIVIISSDELMKNAPEEGDFTVDDLLDSCNDALKYEEEDLKLYLLEDLDENTTLIPSTNNTKAILSEDSPEWIVDYLEEQGFAITFVPSEEATPSHNYAGYGLPSLDEWKAVGLLAAPKLSYGITGGQVNTFYSISGSVDEEGEEKMEIIDNQVTKILCALKGGTLPVNISLEIIDEE